MFDAMSMSVSACHTFHTARGHQVAATKDIVEQDAHGDVCSQKSAHRGIHMWKCSEFRVANQLIWTDMSGRPLRSRGTHRQARRMHVHRLQSKRNSYQLEQKRCKVSIIHVQKLELTCIWENWSTVAQPIPAFLVVDCRGCGAGVGYFRRNVNVCVCVLGHESKNNNNLKHWLAPNRSLLATAMSFRCTSRRLLDKACGTFPGVYETCNETTLLVNTHV